MTQEQVNKVKARIAKQNAKEALKSGNYVNGQKSSTTRRVHSKGNLYNHWNTPIKQDIL